MISNSGTDVTEWIKPKSAFPGYYVLDDVLIGLHLEHRATLNGWRYHQASTAR
jgi:hypothetical protein